MRSLLRRNLEAYRIDLHHHLIPDFYTAAFEELGIHGAFGVSFPTWKPESSIEVMNRNAIATAFVSISTPGVYFKDDAFSRDLARRCNEYSARIINDHGGRFGAFASLPVPDVEGALREMEFALDTLMLDGVALMSNVRGRYPGDPEYEELLAELNRRKAVILIHPNDPPDSAIPEYLWGALDAAMETTRAVMSLLYSGALERYPDLRIILSHVGGIVPYLAKRIALGKLMAGNQMAYDKGMYNFTESDQDPEKEIRLLKRLYFDTLSPAGDTAFRTLLELVEPSHIVLATDYAWLPKSLVWLKILPVQRYAGFAGDALTAIERENALRLFPRLKEA